MRFRTKRWCCNKMQLFCFPICRNSTRWMQNKIWTAIVPVVACIFWTTNNAPINSVHALIWFFVNRDDDTASSLFDFGRYLQKQFTIKIKLLMKVYHHTTPPLIEDEEKSLVVLVFNYFTFGFGHFILTTTVRTWKCQGSAMGRGASGDSLGATL